MVVDFAYHTKENFQTFMCLAFPFSSTGKLKYLFHELYTMYAWTARSEILIS